MSSPEAVLMWADTLRSPDLRHVVPLGIGDPFIYAEHQGRRVAFLPSIEVPRARELDGLEVVPYEEIGLDQLIAKGMRYREARLELLARACEHLGLKEAVTPADFPLAAADLLRGRGVTLRSDDGFFVDRRRVKTAGELEGVRRAQAAAHIAMQTMRNAIRRGGDISSESLRTEALREVAASETFFEYMIVAHGAQAASVHDSGSGRVAPAESIVIDLGVRDWKSGAWADMTRTFSFGPPSAELVEYQSICRLVLEQVTPMVRPGASCAEIYRRADSIIAEAGYNTLLTKKPGTVLESGFVHSLGHGVGLEIHEAPSLGPSGEDLVAGDLITLEPGVYRKGFGGVRLEDLVLVTNDGCEVLTDFPYEL
jgi:Xaa-Pro aminopeptidase